MSNKAKQIILSEIYKIKRKISTKEYEAKKLQETVDELQKQVDEMN